VPIWGAYGPYPSYSVPGVSAYPYPYYEQMPGSVAYIPQNMQTPSADAEMEAAMKAEATPAPAAPTFEAAKAADVAAASGIEGVEADSAGPMGVAWRTWAMGAGGLALLLLLLGGKN
jgi:hypothetical protein